MTMTNLEFSSSFDTLINAYSTRAGFGEQHYLAFDEYEKSVFLTLAQEEVVIGLYSGKNSYGDSFESSEELRRYLESLVKTKTYTSTNLLTDTTITSNKVSNDSYFFELPEDIAFITLEQVKYDDESLGCYNGSIAEVYPVLLDEYTKVIRNPFRGNTKYRVLRLDTGGHNVELISKYKIGQYLIKYLSKPTPIILVDLADSGLNISGEINETPCKLDSNLHKVILNRAVQLAIASKSTAKPKNTSE